LSLLLCIVAPHHHVLLSFPCFSLLGVIVSRCHVLFLFLGARHDCSSSPFVIAIVFRHYALLMFPSLLLLLLLCIAIIVPRHSVLMLSFIVVHYYCLLPLCVLLLLLFVDMRYSYCSLASCAIVIYHHALLLPIFLLSFPKYLYNSLLLLNFSLLCYYCSPSSSLWFGSFDLVLLITFAFVQAREKKHEASNQKNFKVSFYISLLFVCFSFCLYVFYVFYEHVLV
jgi:hypothetical protein